MIDLANSMIRLASAINHGFDNEDALKSLRHGTHAIYHMLGDLVDKNTQLAISLFEKDDGETVVILVDLLHEKTEEFPRVIIDFEGEEEGETLKAVPMINEKSKDE